jgi:FKBP-type peptidyl-prolyl cis-trans isomerase FkpA
MKISIWPFFFTVILLVGLTSCLSSQDNSEQSVPKANLTDSLIKVNRQLVKNDIEAAKKIADKKGWKMQVSKTGLLYEVFSTGNGKKAQFGDRVSLKYTVSLFDGTVCYTSEKLGLKSFKVGQGGVERGLEEGVLLMQAGNKARFIMLPHLAHGLIGDQNKIPARTSIIYEVELVKLERSEK